MHDEIAEFRRLCTVLAQHRRISVGEPLDTSFLDSWPAEAEDRADFAALVSAAYQLWREDWKPDISFLLGYLTGGAAHDFDQLIYQLRTALQHRDNAGAVARFAAWTRAASGGRDPQTGDDWLGCAAALMTALNEALAQLCQTAARGREPAFRSAWQAKVSESPESAVVRVADDLGLWLNPGQRGYHTRQVAREYDRRRLRPGDSATAVLDSYAEQSLVSRMSPLPLSYLDILTELGMLGTPDAVAVLHLAHAVAELTGTNGDVYLKRLTEVWVLLCPPK
jgi:hypothetical protein